MQYLVDTLDFRARCTLDEIFEFLHIKNRDEFEVSEHGFRGYPNALFYNGIRIGFGGLNGFGTYVSMSGKGCRMFEDISDLDWFDLMRNILSMPEDIHMARLDIACDDRTDLLKISRLCKYYAQGKFMSKCKHVVGQMFCVEEFQVGSPSSDTLLRIYNKKLERGFDMSDLDGEPWYRAEFQFRDDSAFDFMSHWVSSGDLGQTYSNRMSSYLRFLKEPNKHDGTQHRIPTASFWQKFLGETSKYKMVSRPGSEYNMEKLKDFCFRTSGSSVVTYAKAMELTPEQLWTAFMENDNIKLRQDQKLFIEGFGNVGQ